MQRSTTAKTGSASRPTKRTVTKKRATGNNGKTVAELREMAKKKGLKLSHKGKPLKKAQLVTKIRQAGTRSTKTTKTKGRSTKPRSRSTRRTGTKSTGKIGCDKTVVELRKIARQNNIKTTDRSGKQVKKATLVARINREMKKPKSKRSGSKC